MKKSGTISCREKNDLDDIRGGILADQPGLGKTVTILSLVMRTRGILPTAPEQSAAFIEAGNNGHDIGWYKIEDQSDIHGSGSRELRTRIKDPVTQRITAISPVTHRSSSISLQVQSSLSKNAFLSEMSSSRKCTPSLAKHVNLWKNCLR